MQDHQRYFPVIDKENKLLPYFITVSNIVSHNQARVIDGNESVLRARLADAAFFYSADKKILHIHPLSLIYIISTSFQGIFERYVISNNKDSRKI